MSTANAMTASVYSFLSLDDESMRRVADVREGITGDEREIDVRHRAEHPHILRIHDQRLDDVVVEIAVARRELDRIACADAFERAEQPIAMRREGAVPRHPRQRRVGQIAD